MSFAIVAAAALTAAAPQSAEVPASIACDATVPTDDSGARGYLLPGPAYAVSGRLKLERKADYDGQWMASGNVQLVSADGRQGAYLIVGGSTEFLGDVVQATLVVLRDGKRHREYEIGVFKSEANLRFTLAVDADGGVKASVGTRSASAKTDFQGQRVAVAFGCHRGAASFSGIATEAAASTPPN